MRFTRQWFVVTADFHCVECWSVDDTRSGGVRPSVLLERAGRLTAASPAPAVSR